MDIQRNGASEELPETDSMENTYLTFYSNNLCLALPILDVIQIIGMQEITPIPEFPPYTKGVINLRGNIISVVDLAMRLSNVETQYTDKTCIIITYANRSFVGFIVDKVDEVKEITPEQIINPSELATEVEAHYLTGIAKQDDKVILLVDTKDLLVAN
jgi:purine-binding chemotaxis protein CheW